MGLKMKIRVFTFKVNIAKDERMSLCRVAAVKHLPVNQYSVVILQFLVLLEYGVQIELETENRSTCSSSRINAHWTILLFIENRCNGQFFPPASLSPGKDQAGPFLPRGRN